MSDSIKSNATVATLLTNNSGEESARKDDNEELLKVSGVYIFVLSGFFSCRRLDRLI